MIAKALHCILHELTEIISVIIGLCVLNNKTNRLVWMVHIAHAYMQYDKDEGEGEENTMQI